jgi:hypothetical protein
VKDPIDPNDYLGDISSKVSAACEHGAEHVICARQPRDGAGWLGALTVADNEEPGYILCYSADTKAEALAEGPRRLREGGCDCPDGVLYRQRPVRRARYMALAAAMGATDTDEPPSTR